MNCYYVYRHIRLDTNEVFYVGLGKNCKYKKYLRAQNTTHRNRWWKNLTSSTSYEVEVIMDNLTIDEAKAKEKEFIKLYGRRDLGLGTLVNLTDGGDGDGVINDEVRKGRSERLSGEKNYWYGKCRSGELNPNFGKRKKLNPCYGQKRSEEVKQKMRDNHPDFSGFNNPAVKLTPEIIQEIKSLKQNNPALTLKAIAKKYNFSTPTIRRALTRQY